MFLTAFAGNAAAAARPEGTCTPPGSWANFTEPGTTIVRAWGAFFPPTGKFYAVGGRFDDTAGDDFTNVNIYDPATDTWSASAATFSDNQVNNMVGGSVTFAQDPGGVQGPSGRAAAAAFPANAVRNIHRRTGCRNRHMRMSTLPSGVENPRESPDKTIVHSPRPSGDSVEN